MLSDVLLQRFQQLNVWRKRDRRAPNKPLLALWAMARCLRGEHRLTTYERVHPELERLLQRFGPHRSTLHTDYPFWRMRNDAVWEVERSHLVRTTPKGDAYVGDLKRHSIRAGFTADVYRALRDDPALTCRIAESLVAKHFPPTRHDAVLEATGMLPSMAPDLQSPEPAKFVWARRRRRDPGFRRRILAAYGGRCAVCSFAGRFDDAPLALEAAHIKWHEADGPPSVDNGLSLCALHHDLFDAGAFTVLPELRLVVASGVSGSGTVEALHRFHGAPLRAPPLEGFPTPAPRYLAWHRTEVFKDATSGHARPPRARRTGRAGPGGVTPDPRPPPAGQRTRRRH